MIRDRTAIAGVGATRFGALYRDLDPERTAYDLAAEAFTQALADSGLAKSDIDGLITVRVPSYQVMAAQLGLPNLRLVNGLAGEGRMAGVAVQYAVLAVASGQAETVAIVYGNNGRSAGMRYGGGGDPAAPSAYDAMYGMTSPGASAAMMFRRHQHEFGTPPEALAALAINNRRNGARNPNAVFRQPITSEEYFAARHIAEPLRLFDYCLINDGGVALIVTSAERARGLRKPPAYIAATQAGSQLGYQYATEDFYYAASRDVAERVYAQAGVTPSEVDCLQVYDNFTPTILFSLEGFGFCPRGKSGDWVRDGRVELDGELPVNTAGGHTAESYMQGFALTVEAVRQVRGEAGPRQVPGCDVVQYICVAPIVTSHIFHR